VLLDPAHELLVPRAALARGHREGVVQRVRNVCAVQQIGPRKTCCPNKKKGRTFAVPGIDSNDAIQATAGLRS
jgi:hypothetical protein